MQAKEFLFELLKQPTAPFYEQTISCFITHELERMRIPFFLDPIGNIVMGVASKESYFAKIQKKTKEPIRMLIAHMDHPGFCGKRWVTPSCLQVDWLGGSPTAYLAGSRVWLSHASDTDKALVDDATGILKKPVLRKDKRALAGAMVEVSGLSHKVNPKDIFGGFSFRKPVWSHGDLIYTKGADDLVGTYNAIRTAKALFSGRAGKTAAADNFLGLITRAEEVGFIGAIHHFSLGWLQKASRPVVCVSLETSRTFPGAEIGKGPVVRLGDRATVFDPGPTMVLYELAKKKLHGKFQRRMMDGGVCEGTVALAYGFSCVGMSVPLGNYHNQGLEGGPDSKMPNGPSPEFVDRTDIDGMLKLCVGLMQPGLNWADPWRTKKYELEKLRRQYRKWI